MRSTKFRAWDNINKKMCAVSALFWNTLEWYVSRAEFNGQYDHTDFVLMQFTGLKDKNGKEIYEGDILLVPDIYTDIVVDGQGPSEEDNHLAPVVFKDGSFGCDIKDNGDYYKNGFVSFPMMEYEMAALFNNELEIIGNIYENPELLEGA